MPHAWSCRCGEVAFTVDDVPESGAHVVCYCADCRAFARLTGGADTLDAAGGVALYQTVPQVLGDARGLDRVACMRLSRRGPYRWYATCCGAAIANTAPSRAMPFNSLVAAGFRDRAALGQPVAKVNLKSATGPVPRPHGSLWAVVASLARRTVAAWLTGGWRKTVFFRSDGTPVSPPKAPEPAARDAAYKGAP